RRETATTPSSFDSAARIVASRSPRFAPTPMNARSIFNPISQKRRYSATVSAKTLGVGGVCLFALMGAAAAHASPQRAARPSAYVSQAPTQRSLLARAGTLRVVEPERRLSFQGHLDQGDPLIPQEWWIPAVGVDKIEPPGPGR